MPNYYTYILSSLPLLSFTAKSAINSQKFLASCAGLLTNRELALLGAIVEDKALPEAGYEILRRWVDFDTALRNELVKLRAGRKRKDPHKYTRDNLYWSVGIIHVAMAAYKNPSTQEAEKALDLERWRFLDELNFGHYFDFESLLIYALKIKILERWEKINRADKEKLLEGALS